MIKDTTGQAVELMKPRRKVINPYPEMERHGLKVGDILIDGGPNECTRRENGDAAFTFEWDKFPHLFKSLQWWEERKPEEMPKYVKWFYMPNVDKKELDGYVQKVSAWSQAGFAVITEGGSHTASKYWLPSNETEYNTYKNNLPIEQNDDKQNNL